MRLSFLVRVPVIKKNTMVQSLVLQPGPWGNCIFKGPPQPLQGASAGYWSKKSEREGRPLPIAGMWLPVARAPQKHCVLKNLNWDHLHGVIGGPSEFR